MEKQNKLNVARHFARAAASYDEYANVQKTMAHELCQLLRQQADNFAKIIEIGCGTGYFTQQLVTAYPQAALTATDIAAAMLEQTQVRLASHKQIDYLCCDGEKALPTQKYDLITSNAVFQWFNAPAKAFNNFAAALNERGYLAFATFGTRTFTELSASFAKAYQEKNLSQRHLHGPQFLSLAQLKMMLHNFDVQFYEKDYKEYFPTVKAFLRSIKKVGAQNAPTEQAALQSRSILQSMLKHYDDDYRDKQGICATYHVIYGIARKKATSLSQAIRA